MFAAQLHEVYGITGNTDGELRIFFRMFHGIVKHFTVQYVHVQVVSAFGEIAIHHCHQIFYAILFSSSQRFRNDGEGVADTVL